MVLLSYFRLYNLKTVHFKAYIRRADVCSVCYLAHAASQENEETLEMGKRLLLPLTDTHPAPGSISHYRWIRQALSQFTKTLPITFFK